MKIFWEKVGKAPTSYNRTMRIKKTGIIMLFACCICMVCATGAFAQEKKISLKKTSGTFKELCSEIERNSEYRFIFSGNVSKKMNDTVSLDIKEGTVEEIVKNLTKKVGVTYKIYEKQVVLYDVPVEKVKKKAPPSPQKKFASLKGSIVDEKGNPLPGVSVYIPASTMGVASDIDGNFDFSLPAGEITLICFDFVGMKHHEHLFNGVDTTINVMMKSDDEKLDEVVVIGYGSKDRKSLTSSISSIKGDVVERLSNTVASVDNLLGGNIKGVFSSQASGEPGAAASINIRGKTSMPSWGKNKTNSPLYVIDGMPFFVEENEMNPLMSISPNDIKSIDVLKDASATAIYGSRGANGVIIVKTKSGKKGDRMNVEVGYTFSVGNPIKEYKPLSISEFKEVQNLVYKNTFDYLIARGKEGMISPSQYEYTFNSLGKFDAQEDPETGEFYLKKYNGLNDEAFGKKYTNWQRAIRNKNAATHQYNVSVRGGSELSNYMLSLNVTDQEGLFINDRLKRYGSRLSLDSDIIPEVVQAGGALNISYSNRKGANLSRGESGGDPVWSLRPDTEIYDSTGEFKYINNSAKAGYDLQTANPVAKRQTQSTFESYSFSGNTYLSVALVKGLTVRADLSVSSYIFKNNFFMPALINDIAEKTVVKAGFTKSDNRSTYTSLSVRADYGVQWGKHNVTAMFGASADRSFNEDLSITGNDFSNEKILNNFASAKDYNKPIEAKLRSGLNSLFSRLSYDFDSRYLVELSLRADESSKFGPGNRVAMFPAVSLGWRINNESFLKDCPKVDDLKLRLSWGKTGSTNVEDFTFLQYYGKKRNYAGDLAFGLEDRLPNRDIRWEMTSEVNAGLDFSFFGDRLRGSIDVYRRVTKGVLADAPFVLESGRRMYTSNLVDLSNQGIEFEISADVIRAGDFMWSSSFNISTNRNRVEKLTGTDLMQVHQDAIVEGYPMGVVKGYRALKILQKEDMPEVKKLNDKAKERYGKDENGEYNVKYYQSPDLGPGDYLMADLNGNGRIDEYDKKVVANPEPKFFGGWNNTFSYKGFSLSLMMQFSYGGESVYTDALNDMAFGMGQSITRETFRRTWTPENTRAPHPRLLLGALRPMDYNIVLSQKNVYKTSYLRMRDITLSYNLSEDIAEMFSLQSVRLFTSISNLFTITSWPGIDPELLGSDLFSAGQGEAAYPFARTFSIGVKLIF